MSRSIPGLLLLAAAAQGGGPPADGITVPSYLRGVGIEQKLNAQVPLDAPFVDEAGHAVVLRDLLRGRPAVLAMVYYTCPMLCDQILRGAVSGMRPLALRPGRDFDVIAISINPKEGPSDAAAKRQEYVTLYSRKASPAGWHFLTGNESSIRAVADAIGFHYRYDPKTGMFFHAAGIMVVTPEGKLARYLYGVDFQPKDLKLGLIEASHNRIGSRVDQVLLFCYHYDARSGKYTARVMSIMQVAAGGSMILLIGGLGFLWRRDLRMRQNAPGEVHRA